GARWLLTNETGPGYVVIDSAGKIFLSPNIKQDKIAFTDALGVRTVRTIMRVRAVRVHSHDRSIAGNYVLPPEGFKNPLLNLKLVCAAVTNSAANFLEGAGGDCIN